MSFSPPQLDLNQLRIRSLTDRHSLTRVDEILVNPLSPAPSIATSMAGAIADCARRIRSARNRGAAVFLIYGAHLLRNGAARIVRELLAQKWITHIATNGAGSIHDWEYAWGGASTERVEENVASGTFGMWQETATCIHAAILTGALDGLGYGASVGRFIAENGVCIPPASLLESQLVAEPRHPLASARADMLDALATGQLREGPLAVPHHCPDASILASAWLHRVPATIHPGIGYDIISNHPLFTGSALGRAGAIDFRVFGAGVEQLDHGVVLSIGSAIMGPQVFEKSISCVNNIRLQRGRPIVHGHSIDVVDLQDGGNWDWRLGEPPKSSPAYYLRFCKSFSRMNGTMTYHQCDNAAFIHHLFHHLIQS